MEAFWKDLRYGFRVLIKNPGYSAVVVLSLALGIGANTTIFTLIDAVFLQPLPVADSDRLVAIYTADEKNIVRGGAFRMVSYPNFKDFREMNTVLSDLAAYSARPFSLATGDQPERIKGMIVTGNYFDLLGVKAALGRTFLPEEDRTPGTHPSVLLSNGLWKRRFGSDPNLIGKTLILNNQSFTVIGITPENFKGTSTITVVDAWVPMMMHDQVLTGPHLKYFNERRALLFNLVGRLKPNISIKQAEAAMKILARQLEKDYPRDNEKRSVAVLPLVQATITPNLRGEFVRAGAVLMTVVGLVLLIACANVASLLLARGAAREKEIAIRLAMGARRVRLIGQLLMESLLLALLAGGVGLLIAFWARDLLWAYRPPYVDTNAIALRLDARVLGFTLAISVLTALIFGLAPSLQASKPNLHETLKEGGRRGTDSTRRRLRSLLVVFEVALSLVAVIGASLFLKSLREAQKIDLGFDTKNLLVMSFDLGAQRYDEARGLEFYRQLLERLKSLPVVKAAGLAANAPLAGGLFRTVIPEGEESLSSRGGFFVLTNSVSLSYFETAGIPILHGRNFTERDRKNAPLVALINETMARRSWPNQTPLGKRFRFFGDSSPIEVVGVTKDSKYLNLGEDPQPYIYLPYLQQYPSAVTLYVHSMANPEGVLGVVRNELHAMDHNLPVVDVSTIAKVIDESLWAPRMGAVLLAIFGVLALVLATLGIYGVISYSVTQRTHEIGVRMSLGAQPRDILKLIIRHGMILTLLGVGIGIAAAFGLTRVVSSLLYGVSATDTTTFVGTSLLMMAIALLATYLPARRATKVDPLNALRYE